MVVSEESNPHAKERAFWSVMRQINIMEKDYTTAIIIFNIGIELVKGSSHLLRELMALYYTKTAVESDKVKQKHPFHSALRLKIFDRDLYLINFFTQTIVGSLILSVQI